MPEPIPVVLVTGSPGSGKTRLICGLAPHFARVGRVAVLSCQTSFFNLDPMFYPPAVLAVDVTGGCTCHRQENIIAANLNILVRVESAGLRMAFVELEGCSLATPTLGALASDERFRPLVVSVVHPGMEEDIDQVEEADLLVLGGEAADLADSDLPLRLKAENPRAMLVRMEELLQQPKWLAALIIKAPARTPPAPSPEGEPHHHRCPCFGMDQPGALAWYPFYTPGPVDLRALEEALGRVPEAVQRAKGVVVLQAGQAPGAEPQGPEDLQRYMAVDLAARQVQIRDLRWDKGPPKVLDGQAIISGEPPLLDQGWLEGGSVLLVGALGAGVVDLELGLQSTLGALFCPAAGPEPAEEAARLLAEARYLEAISRARQALAAQPSSIERLELLASGYHDAGDNRRVLALLQRALELGPRSLSVLLNLARFQLFQEELDQARQLAGEALAIHPDDPEANYVLGQVHLAAGELEPGARLLAAAAEERPGDPELLGSLFQALMDLEQLDQAILVHGRLLELLPEPGGSLFTHGHLLLRADRPSEAQTFFERSLQEGYDFSWVHLFLGIVRLKLGLSEQALGDFDRALECAERQLEEDPQSTTYGLELVLARAAIGELGGARTLLEALMEATGPDSAELDQLVTTLRLLGDAGAASALLAELEEG